MSTLAGALPSTSRDQFSTAAQKPSQEKGWISRATYDSLPAGLQESARDLVKKGRIEIENIVGGSENGSIGTVQS